jgi:hypothetical protein
MSSFWQSKKSRRAAMLSLLLLIPVSLRADWTAEEIVTKTLERDRQLVRHRAAYTYTAEILREKLDANGAVTESSPQTLEVRGDKSPDYGTRPKEGMEGDLKKASKEEPFNILNIINHYNYARVEDESVDNHPCYKIKFSPKGGQPYRNREEKVSNEVEGFLWISRDDFSLAKNVGRLTKPVSVAWFFATLNEMEFSFEARPLPNGELGPAKICYRFRVKVPFAEIHERHTRVMKDYRVAR